MGERGPLRLVKDAPALAVGTAAADVPNAAPAKPRAVAQDVGLSALWDEFVPPLVQSGLLAPSDGPALEMCLRHFQVARTAHASIGDTVEVADPAHGGTKKSPAEAVFRAESELFLRYAQQLGMTFVSRARTPGRHAGGPADNPFAVTG